MVLKLCLKLIIFQFLPYMLIIPQFCLQVHHLIVYSLDFQCHSDVLNYWTCHLNLYQ